MSIKAIEKCKATNEIIRQEREMIARIEVMPERRKVAWAWKRTKNREL